jgi:hypothetical protein
MQRSIYSCGVQTPWKEPPVVNVELGVVIATSEPLVAEKLLIYGTDPRA